MRVMRLSLVPALVVLTSCTTTGPAIYSDSDRVSAADIQTAIELVQQRCIRDKRGSLPVYRVDVDRTDRIFVYCGPHYGVADAAGAVTFTVERKQGAWRISSVSRYAPNPERLIIT
jgi:hypothetical protein